MLINKRLVPLILLTNITSYNSLADIREYEFSLVIFEDTQAQYIDSEKWPTIIADNTMDEKTTSAEHIDSTQDQPTSLSGIESELSNPTNINTHDADTPETINAVEPLHIEITNHTLLDTDLIANQSSTEIKMLTPIEIQTQDVITINHLDVDTLEIEKIKKPLFEPLDFDYAAQDEAEYPNNNNVMNILEKPVSLLSDQIETLNKSKRYNILVNTTWRQTGLNEKDTVKILIDSNNTKPKENDNIDTIFKNLNAIIDESHTKTIELGNQSTITGSIKVVLARYLHFYSDLMYQTHTNSLSPLSNQKSITKSFIIQTHRRMRSKEIHYIDHPLIGMLILAKPVEIETNSDTENES